MNPKPLFVAALLLLCFFPAHSQKLVEVWRTGPVLETPESVYYDEEREVLYVSNINGQPTDKDGNGFISKLNLDGSVQEMKWVTGLDAPKGMAVIGNKLYVTDIQNLVVIDIDNATIEKRYFAPDAEFLNDVAACKNGMLFVSDNHAGLIYLLDEHGFSIWLEGLDYRDTNGLYADGNKLYAGSYVIKEIDVKNKKAKIIEEDCQGIDGLAEDEKGNFVFSNWEGRIFYDNKGKLTKMWDSTAEELNTADLFYIKKKKLLLVPTFFDNQVVAYKIER